MSLLSENIAYYRRKKGITQKELAKKTGLSRSFISQIENNSNTPSNDSLFKISEVLGVSVQELKDTEKNYLKDEETEIIKLLISLTLDLKIEWEKIQNSTEMYSGYFYKTVINGVSYELDYEVCSDIGGEYYTNINLWILYEDNNRYNICSTDDNSKYKVLIELLESIKTLERDKSPLFNIINDLEKLKYEDKKEN